MDDREVGADRAGQELRAAEVDADDVSLGHAGHHTAPRHGRPRQTSRSTRSTASRPRLPWRRDDDVPTSPGERARRPEGAEAASGARRRFTVGRIVAYVAVALGGLAAALARPLPGLRPDPAVEDLRARPTPSSAARGYPLTSPNTILVLGSDARAEGRKESRARRRSASRSRSDSILLLRIGGGAQRARCRSRATPSSTSPATARTRSTPRTRSAARRWRSDTVEQYLGIDDQPPGRGQLRELPAADRRARRHHLQRRLRDLEDQRRHQATAATRCG